MLGFSNLDTYPQKLVAKVYRKVYYSVMRFLEFKKQFNDFNVITHQDIVNVFGDVNQSQMSDWKTKKYIKNVRKGTYVFTDVQIDINLLANELNDSYISLESALSYHQMIPEIAPSITSVSNERGESIENDFGTFYYHKITPKLFNGFELIESTIKPQRFIRMAEKEKALFDLVYFRDDLSDASDFKSLRLNLEDFNVDRLKQFIELVGAPQIRSRLENLITYLYAVI